MSSYASYCQDQASDCARRARLASSPEVVAYCRSLEFRWLRLAEQAQETGGALGHESNIAAALLPLGDKAAAYPVEYGKRAGELIARAARRRAKGKRSEHSPLVSAASSRIGIKHGDTSLQPMATDARMIVNHESQ